jgi:hypothetical protein
MASLFNDQRLANISQPLIGVYSIALRATCIVEWLMVAKRPAGKLIETELSSLVADLKAYVPSQVHSALLDFVALRRTRGRLDPMPKRSPQLDEWMKRVLAERREAVQSLQRPDNANDETNGRVRREYAETCKRIFLHVVKFATSTDLPSK